jgi:hypothetical protein
MQRLAALVPRPRLHLIRFHGVLAPNANLRSEIIPSTPEPATESSTDHAQGTPARMSRARLLKRVFDIEHCPNDRFYSRLTRFRSRSPRRSRRGTSHLERTPRYQSKIRLQRTFRPAAVQEERRRPADRRGSRESQIADLVDIHGLTPVALEIPISDQNPNSN